MVFSFSFGQRAGLVFKCKAANFLVHFSGEHQGNHSLAPPVLQHNCGQQQHPACKRTNKMNCPSARLAVRADILGPKIIEIRGVVHPAESSTGGITGNLESLSDIFSSGRELVAQIFLRIPISKTDKPSRSIEI